MKIDKIKSKNLFKKALLFFIVSWVFLLVGNKDYAFAAGQCVGSFAINGKTKTLQIINGRILKDRVYKIYLENNSSFEGNKYYNNIIAKEDGLVSLSFDDFIFPGKQKYTLSLQKESNDICEGEIFVEYPNDCKWSIVPVQPNEKAKITLSTSMFQFFKGPPSLSVVYPDGTKKKVDSLENEFNWNKNATNYNFTAPKKGPYDFKLVFGTNETRFCSATISFGDKNNQGTGLWEKPIEEAPAKTAEELCDINNQKCIDCIKGETYKKIVVDKETLFPGSWTALGCIPTGDPQMFITWIGKYMIFIASGIGFLLMISGAVQVLTSSGDPEKLKSGTGLITSALGGLLFVALSIFLLKVIGVDILQIPGF